jgi:hypothetical protein
MDENNYNFIKQYKTRITKLMNEYKYQEAFNSLIITLNNLNGNDRNDIIQYFYDLTYNKYNVIGNSLNPVARF